MKKVLLTVLLILGLFSLQTVSADENTQDIRIINSTDKNSVNKLKDIEAAFSITSTIYLYQKVELFI